LEGVTITSPGSPPADRAANAAIGSGSLVDDGGNGSLKENISLEAGDDEDELYGQMMASECVKESA